MRRPTLAPIALGLLLLVTPPLTAHPPAVAQQPPGGGDERPGAEVMDGEATEGDAEEAWDVSAPPEPFPPLTEISLDVDTGTWMSVDVSPDGREVVFDLLGNLYTVPIEGGEATALTSGLAWDMQPSYSPDGRSIAFTSDRGGGDNLWIIDRDGSNPRQVSDESFRLLNSPAWTPDGAFIAARKHYTSRRSLGAGEIWLYHVSGGDGLQMVERPNDQKDLGEPAFSPDGRYLYYSQDVTPGEVFEYNKDPNGEIYAVKRLDRETGETVELLGGPGGAIRPTPSPDGEHLAFIRRVRGKSVLHVMHRTSGETWPVYDELDRSMQETWAIHGVYPSMAWTPDSAGLVFWAGGKIRHLDVASGEVSVIPFRVRDSRRVAEALRFPVEVHPERFTLRMLRWVQVAPTGDRVAFQALGRIWVRELPDGEPYRLTPQEEHFEQFPRFTRDGSSIVYTTWDDAELGTVRIAPATGGAGRLVVDTPGHYVEPAVSPDGAWVVYRKVDGGYLRTPTWSAEPGIYRVPAEGGTPERITRQGTDPHFGASSERVYLLRFAAEGKRSLASIALDGSEEREHLSSDNATTFRVSPDGRWVAFREYFRAYIAPFVATGRAQQIGPDSTAIPVAEASQEAGEYLHWSGDSERLHWALGPDLYSLELTEAFEFLGGEESGETETGGDEADAAQRTRIGFEVASDLPGGTIAFVGGRIITMRGEEVIEDGTLLVEGNRIAAVGRRDEVEVPAGAHVVQAHGKTLIPGLVDVHWHGAQGSDDIIPETSWVDSATLAYGVTTIHDPSNDTATIFAAAEMARAGVITAPRTFSTGTILYGAKAPVKAVIETLDDARFHVDKLAAVGAISVKSYNQPRRDQRQKVLAAAREAELMVLPEGGSLFQHNMSMVVDGHTGIEHAVPVAALYDDVVDLWSATGVGYTPTLVVGYGGLWGENYWYAKTPVWEDERLLSFVPRRLLDARSRRRTTAPEEEWGHFDLARGAATLSAAGVDVQLGAHGQREGLGAHWELWMFGQGGMSPHQALRSATLEGARYLGMDGDIGSLEPGKLADLVLLDANPLEDLRSSTRIDAVMLNGRLYDGETLDQIAPDPQAHPPLYWQRQAGFFTP